MTINRVNQYPLSQLFDTEAKLIFEIPKYQREYTWGVGQWENLFDDLTENKEGYFLGTIICIDTTIDSINAPKREVIDGQQRLTTLSLLLTALYAKLTEYGPQLTDDQKLDLRQLKLKLVLKTKESQFRVVPQTQNSNLDDYKGVLAEQKILPPHPMPKFAGNRRIKKAFEYFKKRITEEVDRAAKEHSVTAADAQGTTDESPLAIETLFNTLAKVNSAVMVMIEVSNHADAYILFESLNNRGTPLTAIDLIKNLLLARLETSGGESIDYYFAQWQQVLEYIGDEYSIQERFFRHNYNAFRRSINTPFVRPGDASQYPLGPLAMRSNLLSIYEKVITNNPRGCIESLIANALMYSRIILTSAEGLSPTLQEKYLDLSRIQGVPSYLLLLYLEKERTALSLSDAEMVKTISLLVNFFVRRNLTNTPPTYELTRIFMGLIEEIEASGYTSGAVYDAIRKKLHSYSASDTVFEEKLRGPVYSDNFDATRFILCTIAKRGMTVESKVDLWNRTGNNQYVWTIEHIFPQGENIPESWVNMIAGSDTAKAKAYQQQYVHTFGNLTITGYNSRLSNSSFTDKCPFSLYPLRNRRGIFIIKRFA